MSIGVEETLILVQDFVFSFGSTIKEGMDGQLDLCESSGLGEVHTCQIQHQVAPKQPLDQLEQTSFTYDCELKVNGGSNVDRTLVQSLVSSFDQGEIIWMRPDAER